MVRLNFVFNSWFGFGRFDSYFFIHPLCFSKLAKTFFFWRDPTRSFHLAYGCLQNIGSKVFVQINFKKSLKVFGIQETWIFIKFWFLYLHKDQRPKFGLVFHKKQFLVLPIMLPHEHKNPIFQLCFVLLFVSKTEFKWSGAFSVIFFVLN